MIKIVVTGGSGFIGSNYISYLLTNKNVEIINIDCNNSIIPDINKITYLVDINHYEPFEKKILEFQPDYIIHLAAVTDLNGNEIDYYSTNIQGVDNLLKVVQLLPNLKKVIITSSMLVCQVGYYPKDQFDYFPTTLYGQSKVETEKKVWSNMPHCDWAIIRPTSIWGPRFGVPYRNFFDLIISHNYFHIGNRGCTKTYGYIENAIYQIERILLSDTNDINNKIFYIGDSPPINIEIWANEIADELGYKVIKLPFFIIKIAAWVGDMLKRFGFNFPMTSFRLKNMTTNNIIDLNKTYAIAPNPPCSRIAGIRKTLNWINAFR